jgi:hypothetical protein
MRLHDGIRVLAATAAVAAIAAPAAQAVQPMQPSGGGPAAAPVAAAPVVSQQSDGSTDWLLIGAGTGIVVLIGGVAGAGRFVFRFRETH